MNETEIRRKLLAGERLIDNKTHYVLQQNIRGYFIVSDGFGNRISPEQIKGLSDAIKVWRGANEKDLPFF